MRNVRIWLALGLGAALLALTITACGSSESSESGASGGKIKFGLISPFSGSSASYGPPEKVADEEAIKLINEEGGVKVGDENYDFELKTYDSAYEPNKAVTAAHQAIDQDGIKYLEVLGGGIVPAVQPITEPAGVLVFAVADGGEFVGKDHPLTFRPYYDLPESVAADLEYLKPKLPADAKVVHLYPDEDLGHSVAPEAEERTKELGMQSETVFTPRESTEFAPVLSKVIRDADVIDFGPTPPTEYALMVKQARQLGYEGTFIFPDTLYLETVLESVSPKEVAGSVASPAWQNLKTERGKQYEAAEEKKIGSVEGWTAQPFDNLFLLKAAMEKAGTLDTEKVAEALSEVEVEGALGKVSYGGEKTYGLPRVFEIPYPVAEVTPKGELKIVSDNQISG